MQAQGRVAIAATLAVRHAGAYGDLIRDDVGRAYHAFARRFWAAVILSAALAFAIAMACIWVIAVAWDTTGRLWAIASLFGLFVLASVCAFVALKMFKRQWPGLLPNTGSEWQKDCLLLEDLLVRGPGDSDG